MLKNYLKLGFRSLEKNKLSSAINILGLALAVGCCLVVFQFFDWSMHMDNFHHKLDKLFVIERISQKNGNEQYWGTSPSPMGPMLKNDFQQIKNITRLSYTGAIIKQGDNIFREEVTFVDNSFYQMFDFPVKWGSKQRFSDQDGIVLTEDLSEKFFGKENSVGKTLSLRFNSDGHESIVNFTVKGVLEKLPIESSFHFSALAPSSKMASLGMDKTGDWKQLSDITFIEADNEASLVTVQKQSNKYLQLFNAANKDDKITAFHFQPLKTMGFHAYKVLPLRFNETNIAGYIMLFVIAIATLLLVYFNYMNIAIASASSRLKEIGVRKVMGSSRKQIIIQFITENLVLCTIAITIGLILAKYIFIPWFSQLGSIDFTKDFFNNYRTWVICVVLIVLSAISGAAYPSFYISAFKPVNIMKGNNKMGSKNRFRKFLLGFQFFLTFLAISIALAFIQETKHLKGKSWGYDPANNVVVALDKNSNFEAFRDALKRNNDVVSVTGSVQPLGKYSRQMVIKTEGADQTVQGLSALPGFATQMGIKVTKGRDMSAAFGTDQTSSVLVNQAFLKQMHWTTGIGKTIEYDKYNYLIVGEVADFHFENFQTPIGPMLLMGCKPADVAFVYAKTNTGLFSNAHTSVEKDWKKVNPNLPFEYYYQDSVFDFYFRIFSQVSQVMAASSVIMIVISITGIFGLALLILGRKMKEISVRKVLGAGIGNIIFIINKEFLFAVGFAVLFGFPISWYLTGNLFRQISVESHVSLTPLIISFVGLLLMIAVSVSWHIFKAHTANPTRYLKDE